MFPGGFLLDSKIYIERIAVSDLGPAGIRMLESDVFLFGVWDFEGIFQGSIGYSINDKKIVMFGRTECGRKYNRENVDAITEKCRDWCDAEQVST